MNVFVIEELCIFPYTTVCSMVENTRFRNAWSNRNNAHVQYVM